MPVQDLYLTHEAELVSSNAAVFRVDVHTGIAAHGGHWPRAGSGSAARCHVFQTVEFLEAWLETYGAASRAEPLYVSVRESNGALLMLLPLAITRVGGVRRLTFVDATACDYNAPILFPTERRWTPDSAAALWREIVAALPPFDLVSLVKLPADIDGLVNPLYLIAADDNPEACHGIDLHGPWEKVEATIAGLRTLRKSARALQRIAPVELVVAETPEQRRLWLAALLAQKQRRFDETRVPGFEEHPEKSAFFEKAGEIFAKVGALHLCALTVGGEIVATAWGLIHAERYYGLMIGSDGGQWARYSPGRILYRELAKALHDQGCLYLDSGIGDEPWKIANCDRTVALRMYVQAVTWRGHALLAGRRALEGLRGSRLWQRVRPYKWILLRQFRRRFLREAGGIGSGIAR